MGNKKIWRAADAQKCAALPFRIPARLQHVEKFAKSRRRWPGNNPPKALFILDDVAFARVVSWKDDDPACLKSGLRRCFVRVDFLQDPVDPRVERFFEQTFLFGAQRNLARLFERRRWNGYGHRIDGCRRTTASAKQFHKLRRYCRSKLVACHPRSMTP